MNLTELQADYLLNRYFIYSRQNFQATYGIKLPMIVSFPDRDRRAEASLMKRGLLHDVKREGRWGVTTSEIELTSEGLQLASDLYSKPVTEALYQAWADAVTFDYFWEYFDMWREMSVKIEYVRDGVVTAKFSAQGVGDVYLQSFDRDFTISYVSGLRKFTGYTIDRLNNVLENAEYIHSIICELRS
jgi:hypothetical protein